MKNIFQFFFYTVLVISFNATSLKCDEVKDLIDPSLGYRFFFIYQKLNDPYGNLVKKKKISNRTIHYVPNIQK